jgi:hypothetical protein
MYEEERQNRAHSDRSSDKRRLRDRRRHGINGDDRPRANWAAMLTVCNWPNSDARDRLQSTHSGHSPFSKADVQQTKLVGTEAEDEKVRTIFVQSTNAIIHVRKSQEARQVSDSSREYAFLSRSISSLGSDFPRHISEGVSRIASNRSEPLVKVSATKKVSLSCRHVRFLPSPSHRWLGASFTWR